MGVSLPGHQARILHHLPVPGGTTWPEEPPTLPSLPPKTKSIHDSILFKDLNIDAQTRQNRISPTQNQGTVSPDGALTSSPTQRVSPKPVPRPRNVKQTETEPIKPKALPRPVPAPRRTSVNNRSEPTTPTQVEEKDVTQESYYGNIEDVDAVMSRISGNDTKQEYRPERPKTALFTEVTKSLEKLSKTDKSQVLHQDSVYDNVEEEIKNSRSDTKRSENQLSLTGEINVVEEANSPVITPGSRESKQLALSLEGACVDETSTENMSSAEYFYSKPDKSKGNKTNTVNVSESVSKSIDGNGDDSEDDIYQNVPQTKDTKPVTPTSSLVQSQGKANPQLQRNISLDEFDPLANPKATVNQGDAPVLTGTVRSLEQDIEDSGIYEPIWEKGDKPVPSNATRNSNIMQLSPSVDMNTASDRVSTYSANRDSAAFEMPHPMFPPPPLPAGASGDTFDQSSGPNMPPIPPRPPNYKAPKFKQYVNVGFLQSGESQTLPGGTEGNMEPDALNSPLPVGYGDAVESHTFDPFHGADPFGDFKPDLGDHEEQTFPPVSCQSKAASDQTFVNAFTGSAFSTRTDDIYEVAQDPHDTFDPFGLNPTASGSGMNRVTTNSSLVRSVSSTSSGSNHSLSQVVPAPKWPHTVPAGDWFKPQSSDCMYSLAGQTSK